MTRICTKSPHRVGHCSSATGTFAVILGPNLNPVRVVSTATNQ